MSTKIYTTTLRLAVSLAAASLLFTFGAQAQPLSLDARDQELAARRRAIFAEDEFFTPQGDIADPNVVLMPPPQPFAPNAIRTRPTQPTAPERFGVVRTRRYFGVPYRSGRVGRGDGMYRPRFNSYYGYYPEPSTSTRVYYSSPNLRYNNSTQFSEP